MTRRVRGGGCGGCLRAVGVAMLPLLLSAHATGSQSAGARGDPARDTLLAIARRFGDAGAVATVEVRVDKPGRGQEDYVMEAWSRTGRDGETLAIFLLAPERRKGTAFRLDRTVREGRTVEVRHTYLPSQDQLAEIRGLRRRSLERQISGILGVTLFELGEDFRAEDLGEGQLGQTRARRIRVISGDGDRYEIWVEDQGGPVIRQMRQFSKNGRDVIQTLEVNETLRAAGCTIESAGTMSGPGKPTVRFKVRSLRRPSPAERVVFTREGFADHGRAIARGSGVGAFPH